MLIAATERLHRRLLRMDDRSAPLGVVAPAE
jgi:hypothetical protein